MPVSHESFLSMGWDRCKALLCVNASTQTAAVCAGHRPSPSAVCFKCNIELFFCAPSYIRSQQGICSAAIFSVLS